MPDPTSLSQIDLTPIPGKRYFTLDREWREEFIYFLMVDRFHDGQDRSPVLQANRSAGIQTPEDFYGGKIKGITNHLDYIAGLGCTAIWLSPVFENNAGAYHGYNINNYLGIDPHFGTKEDLVDLVNAAHSYSRNGQPFPIRIILDVVINHSGDNWAYPDDNPYYYLNDEQFPFGFWRSNDRPIPTDLRDPNWYHRRGQIRNYDASVGSDVINALIKTHCYWIREADVDGFRVDAVKHMNPLACSRFCSNVREYAYSLGKRGFFLFGEVATPDDDIYNRYIGQNTSVSDGSNTVFFGLDSVLDFRLAEGVYGDDNNAPLRDVLKGFKGPQTLFNRLEAQRQRALNRGEIGRYLVRFVDNHDSFWQPTGRFANNATDEQVIGAVGFLLCALGTACLYYGTEQGFSGQGGDNQIREAMFSPAVAGRNLLNTDCRIYQEIAKIAGVMRTSEPLRFGRMYFRQISGNGSQFGFPFGLTYTLAFSRLLYGEEVLVAYNVTGQPRSDFVIVDSTLHSDGSSMRFLYGGVGAASVRVSTAPDGSRYVRLSLPAYGFAILS